MPWRSVSDRRLRGEGLLPFAASLACSKLSLAQSKALTSLGCRLGCIARSVSSFCPLLEVSTAPVPGCGCRATAPHAEARLTLVLRLRGGRGRGQAEHEHHPVAPASEKGNPRPCPRNSPLSCSSYTSGVIGQGTVEVGEGGGRGRRGLSAHLVGEYLGLRSRGPSAPFAGCWRSLTQAPPLWMSLPRRV